MKVNSKSLNARLPGFALVGVLIVGWEMAVRSGFLVSDNAPPFTGILIALFKTLASGELSSALLSTLYRSILGFLSGSFVGIFLGVVLGLVPLLNKIFRPLVEVVRTLPSPALVPPLILFLGVDDALKIFVIALTVQFPVFINTFSAIVGFDDTLRLTTRTFGLGLLKSLTSVYIPAILPAIMAGMRISLPLAIITAVVAEMISGSSGIGYYLMSMQYALRTDVMYAAVISVSLVGYVLNSLMRKAERRLLFWHPSNH